jgi:hypothetical protein
MASIRHIFFFSEVKADNKAMRVSVNLKPSGQADIYVKLPDDFYDCIMSIALLAADKHEQEMRAQILADTAKETPHDHH